MWDDWRCKCPMHQAGVRATNWVESIKALRGGVSGASRAMSVSLAELRCARFVTPIIPRILARSSDSTLGLIDLFCLRCFNESTIYVMLLLSFYTYCLHEVWIYRFLISVTFWLTSSWLSSNLFSWRHMFELILIFLQRRERLRSTWVERTACWMLIIMANRIT